MTKRRKTRSEKINATKRREKEAGFVIKDKWLKSSGKKEAERINTTIEEKKFFKADLTRSLILTMLVLALELAIWLYLSKLK